MTTVNGNGDDSGPSRFRATLGAMFRPPVANQEGTYAGHKMLIFTVSWFAVLVAVGIIIAIVV